LPFALLPHTGSGYMSNIKHIISS